MTKISNNFFSISIDIISSDQYLPYDLYINSSTNEEKEKFVRIFPKADFITVEELRIFKKKYYQLYVHESQRELYLKNLLDQTEITTVKKTEAIKSVALHYLEKIFDKDKEFSNEVLSETLTGCKVTVESMVAIVKDYDVSEIQKIIANLSFHDFYTYDHSINVSMYCIALYSAYRPDAPKEDIVLAGLGGLLHDIGKLKISTNVINKPGVLDHHEFEIIKKHPEYGIELLTENNCKCEGINFEIIKRIVYEHHENFNGTGYPRSLSGINIHILARLTAIADFFDAITTKRTYSEVLSIEDAISVMSKSVGRKLDPELFSVFTKSVRSMVISGLINRELPDDFDPCQPHNILPFTTPKRGYRVEGFGSRQIKEKKKAA